MFRASVVKGWLGGSSNEPSHLKAGSSQYELLLEDGVAKEGSMSLRISLVSVLVLLLVDVGAAEGRKACAVDGSIFPKESAPVDELVRCRLICRTEWSASFGVSADDAESVLAAGNAFVGKASPQYTLRLQHFDVLVQ
jgi:hypothetical protein